VIYLIFAVGISGALGFLYIRAARRDRDSSPGPALRQVSIYFALLAFFSLIIPTPSTIYVFGLPAELFVFAIGYLIVASGIWLSHQRPL
jgi:hypothetical protein